VTPKRIVFVTFSPTTYDSRVRRMVRTAADAGYAVSLLSADTLRPNLPIADHVALPRLGASHLSLMYQLLTMLPATCLPAAALPMHASLRQHRIACRALARLRPDIIHANDWVTLPAAIAAETQARIVYDTHEMATEEHVGRFWWRHFARPHIASVEARLIGKADQILTVGHGLAGSLTSRYGAAIRQISVIRNLPELPERRSAVAASDGLQLVYAGLIRPERKLDVMIKALRLADRPWRLKVVGFGPGDYLAALRQLAIMEGVRDRVEWVDAVSPEGLVDALSGCDIGLFLSAGEAAQERFALPNKIFEYTAAGLAILSSGSVDVAALLADHGHGLMLESASPEALAKALNNFDPQSVTVSKRLACEAANVLDWRVEGQKLLSVYADLTAASVARIT
jgi:glycogen synthase